MLRVYSGTLTITAPAGQTITGLTFNLNTNSSSSRWGNDNAANTGTLDGKDKTATTATWTGNASEVVITIKNNTQIGSINVTLGGGSSAAPRRAESVKYYAKDDSGNTIQVFNNFHIEAFDDYSTFVNEKKYDVKGIVTVYKTTYELYTIEMNEADVATAIKGVEARMDVNAPIYNLAGQQVGMSYKGVVIQNGKKFILK